MYRMTEADFYTIFSYKDNFWISYDKNVLE